MFYSFNLTLVCTVTDVSLYNKLVVVKYKKGVSPYIRWCIRGVGGWGGGGRRDAALSAPSRPATVAAAAARAHQLQATLNLPRAHHLL